MNKKAVNYPSLEQGLSVILVIILMFGVMLSGEEFGGNMITGAALNFDGDETDYDNDFEWSYSDITKIEIERYVDETQNGYSFYVGRAPDRVSRGFYRVSWEGAAAVAISFAPYTPTLGALTSTNVKSYLDREKFQRIEIAKTGDAELQDLDADDVKNFIPQLRNEFVDAGGTPASMTKVPETTLGNGNIATFTTTDRNNAIINLEFSQDAINNIEVYDLLGYKGKRRYFSGSIGKDAEKKTGIFERKDGGALYFIEYDGPITKEAINFIIGSSELRRIDFTGTGIVFEDVLLDSDLSGYGGACSDCGYSSIDQRFDWVEDEAREESKLIVAQSQLRAAEYSENAESIEAANVRLQLIAGEKATVNAQIEVERAQTVLNAIKGGAEDVTPGTHKGSRLQEKITAPPSADAGAPAPRLDATGYYVVDRDGNVRKHGEDTTIIAKIASREEAVQGELEAAKAAQVEVNRQIRTVRDSVATIIPAAETAAETAATRKTDVDGIIDPAKEAVQTIETERAKVTEEELQRAQREYEAAERAWLRVEAGDPNEEQINSDHAAKKAAVETTLPGILVNVRAQALAAATAADNAAKKLPATADYNQIRTDAAKAKTDAEKTNSDVTKAETAVTTAKGISDAAYVAWQELEKSEGDGLVAARDNYYAKLRITNDASDALKEARQTAADGAVAAAAAAQAVMRRVQTASNGLNNKAAGNLATEQARLATTRSALISAAGGEVVVVVGLDINDYVAQLDNRNQPIGETGYNIGDILQDPATNEYKVVIGVEDGGKLKLVVFSEDGSMHPRIGPGGVAPYLAATPTKVAGYTKDGRPPSTGATAAQPPGEKTLGAFDNAQAGYIYVLKDGKVERRPISGDGEVIVYSHDADGWFFDGNDNGKRDPGEGMKTGANSFSAAADAAAAALASAALASATPVAPPQKTWSATVEEETVTVTTAETDAAKIRDLLQAEANKNTALRGKPLTDIKVVTPAVPSSAVTPLSDTAATSAVEFNKRADQQAHRNAFKAYLELMAYSDVDGIMADPQAIRRIQIQLGIPAKDADGKIGSGTGAAAAAGRPATTPSNVNALGDNIVLGSDGWLYPADKPLPADVIKVDDFSSSITIEPGTTYTVRPDRVVIGPNGEILGRAADSVAPGAQVAGNLLTGNVGSYEYTVQKGDWLTTILSKQLFNKEYGQLSTAQKQQVQNNLGNVFVKKPDGTIRNINRITEGDIVVFGFVKPAVGPPPPEPKSAEELAAEAAERERLAALERERLAELERKRLAKLERERLAELERARLTREKDYPIADVEIFIPEEGKRLKLERDAEMLDEGFAYFEGTLNGQKVRYYPADGLSPNAGRLFSMKVTPTTYTYTISPDKTVTLQPVGDNKYVGVEGGVTYTYEGGKLIKEEGGYATELAGARVDEQKGEKKIEQRLYEIEFNHDNVEAEEKKFKDIRWKKLWARRFTAILHPSRGALEIGEWVTGPLEDLINTDITWDPRGIGKIWGYTLAGDYASAVCDEWRDSPHSEHWIQDYPGHFVSSGASQLGNIMWANGKRIEYAGGSWDEGYRCSFTPKWFPKLEADEVSPLGYLYKISWYITHPYTKQQVDSMRDYEKEDNGLNEDGNITYRIELIGDGCSTPEVSNGYNMPYPDFYKLEPGGIASVTWSYYDLAKIDSICIRFDKWKYDGENNGWCEELAVESESSQTVGVFGNFDEGTTAVQSSSGGFTASGGEATGATSAPEAVEKDCPPSFPQC